MMGRQSGVQDRLCYSFNLDEQVPRDHLLRGIDRYFDLSELHEQLAPFYSHTGRPSIDPELMMRMLVVGYCFGIRSERRLCEEVRLNLAYRWFCKLDLEDAIPDHSTFSKNRHGRFRESDVFQVALPKLPRRVRRLPSCFSTRRWASMTSRRRSDEFQFASHPDGTPPPFRCEPCRWRSRGDRMPGYCCRPSAALRVRLLSGRPRCVETGI